jgi:hypothetical protein
MQGYESFYRIRLGDYRIGIEVFEDEIIFVRFFHKPDRLLPTSNSDRLSPPKTRSPNHSTSNSDRPSTPKPRSPISLIKQ